MMDFDTSNKRLAKNTIVLYVRMLLSMVISLYTSRVTLQYLGVDNYGIYNVIGGVVVFVTMISAAFTNSTQRFLALALGKNNKNLLRNYFLTLQNLHILLSLLFLAIAELICSWLIEDYLIIPHDRIDVAYLVFHLSVLTMVISMITIPYTSLMIAAERLAIYAYIGIFEQLIKLGGLLVLIHISGDPLVWYTSLMLTISIIVISFYGYYCSRNYWRIVKYSFEFDKGILKEICAFVSWAYLGSFSGIAKEHGVNIIIGHYFGVAVNAARGVSMQVYGSVSAFGSSFISALRPQIVKSYGAGEVQHSVNLTSRGVKITFFLMYLMVLPLILECSFILNLWLVEVPHKAVAFTELVLVLCVLRAIQDPINTLYLAIGKIKKSQIMAVIYTFLCLIICTIAFYMGMEPEVSVWISICLELANIVTVCYLLSELIIIDWSIFLQRSLFPILKVLSLTAPLLIIIVRLMSDDILRFVIVVPLSIVVNIVSIYLVGLDRTERDMVRAFIKRRLKRF